MSWLFRLEAADAKEDGENGNTAQWRKFHQPNTGSKTVRNCRGSLIYSIVLEEELTEYLRKTLSENQTVEYVQVFSVISFLGSAVEVRGSWTIERWWWQQFGWTCTSNIIRRQVLNTLQLLWNYVGGEGRWMENWLTILQLQGWLTKDRDCACEDSLLEERQS